MRAKEFTGHKSWADKSSASGWTRNMFDDPDYVLVWANIEDVMNNTENMQRISLKARTKDDDENIIGNRVQKAKDFWLQGGKMNPSEIGWNDRTNAINFTDGRHRLVAAHQLGMKYAPMFVEKDSLEKIKTIVRIK